MTTNRTYIGARIQRREDHSLLTGRGLFVADVSLPRMLHLVLVRSQLAHARIESVALDPARVMPGVAFAIDGRSLSEALRPLEGMQVSAPPGWSERVSHRVRLPAQPILAVDKVHYAGQPYAAILGEALPAAEDAAQMIEAQMTPLPPNVDPHVAASPDAPFLHPELGTNVLARMEVSKGDVTGTLAGAPRRLARRIAHHRYAAMPLECRAVVAAPDPLTGGLTVWTTSQVAHWVRTQIAAALDLAEDQVRVVAPHVGGGFGVKGHVYPEELLVAYLAHRLQRPVRWLEQRSEHFLASTHSRDTTHDVDVAFDEQGRLLALRAHGLVDTGAYCPVGAGVAYNTIAHMLGPYDVAHFEASTTVVCTNKAPNAPYRGAGRPEAAQVMERIMDLVAAALDLEPAQVRLRNMIQPEQMPYDVGLPYRDGQPIVYDSGDYPKALATALDAIGGVAAFRARQRVARGRGRFLGLGIGCYTEGTGVGPFEGARVRLDRRGKLVVSVGACAQGQGHETVFAQVAADAWGMPIEDVVIEGGDTAKLSMGYGTVGSRSAVTASMAIEGATAAVKRKVLAIAGELLEASVEDLAIEGGGVCVKGAPALRKSFAEIAAAALPGWGHRRPDHVSPGLEAVDYYEPPTVTWSYAANAAIVEIDPETGVVRIEHYVEVHDAGVLLNPMLADGQVMGGIAQGVGGGLLESIVYDADGQLLTGSFLDYALPRARDIPPVTIIHHQSPSPLNALGVKGLGEGGAIAPPVVIANAVADALGPRAVEFNALPLRAEAIRVALLEAQRTALGADYAD